MRKKLFEAIDSINPKKKGIVRAIDFIKFKVIYQVLSEKFDWKEACENEKNDTMPKIWESMKLW
jgi:hypothetical protein